MKLLIFHFMRTAVTIGMINALKLLYLRLFSQPARISIKGYSSKILVRSNGSDYHAFYTVFIRKDYPIPINSNAPDVIFDIGANVGYSAIYFSILFPSSKIICVEPDPSNFEQLKTNLDANEQITLLQRAIVAGPQRKVALVGDGISARVSHEELSPAHILSYNINDLINDFLPHNNAQAWVKMDIEGSEKEIFEDKTDWLDKIQYLYIEIHKGCWKSVFDALKRTNYDVNICGENLLIDIKRDGE